MISNPDSKEIADKDNGLLSSEERASLGQIATKDPPYGQRAQALLAIDGGATQAEAGRLAGLTAGQVRYWLAKFRRDGTNIFPDELLDQTLQVDPKSPHSLAIHANLRDVPDPQEPVEIEAVQQELADAKKMVEPVYAELVENPDMSRVNKKSKKAKKSSETKKEKKTMKANKSKKDKVDMKGNKAKKKTKKAVEAEKPKKDKKSGKGKKSQKKSKKDTPQKKKSKKGDSKRKKSKK